jgi:hypothetical protein
MPSGDREVVQRLIDHWEVGEFAPALSHLHSDVVVVNQVSGHTGLRATAGCAALSGTGIRPSRTGLSKSRRCSTAAAAAIS